MEGFCRGCLLRYDEPTDLMQYTEKYRRLFVYSTGLQVKRNDTFTFQLCKECYINMKQSCKFKKQCRTSDKKIRNYLLVKEDADDFASFIKNIDGNLSQRLPLLSGHSTPAYQRNREDDNESTCTSIRNFMTDILEGEEMPPTEARIIREVIEEEADVLDDSLDSDWLQDDMTIGSDFDVDFGISPFGTPRSVKNDEYTPRKINEGKEREINYLTTAELLQQINKPRNSQKFDMPLLDENKDMENTDEIKIKNFNTDISEQNLKPLAPELQELDNSIPSEVEDMLTENSISSPLQCYKTDLLADLVVRKQMDDLENDNANFGTLDETPKGFTAILANKIAEKTVISTSTNETNETDICIVLNQGIAEKKPDAPLTNELDYYVTKAKMKKEKEIKNIKSVKDKSTEYHCSIDRNLDIALKFVENKQFSLDHLLVSPAASVHSGVSTPTINNILFGDNDKETVSNPKTSTPTVNNILFEKQLVTGNTPKYFPQVGQSILDFEDDIKNDSMILDELIKNKRSLDLSDTIKDEIKNVCPVKKEPEDFEIHSDDDQTEEEPNQDTISIKSEDHKEVLEEFLRAADSDPTKLNKEIIDEIIDPIDLSKELTDKDIFKRPQTPPYDKYDLEKGLCKVCDKTFTSSKSLKIHFCKIHKYKLPNPDPYRNKTQNAKITICPICGKQIKGVANYVKHKQRHDDKLVDVFQCNVCTLFFKTRGALQTHMRMHMGLGLKKKKFVCSTCGHPSSTSSHHNLHQRRHLKKISDTCEICHKGFYSAYDLKVHMRKHNGERPFNCQYCPKTYKRRETLFQHVKRHMGKLEFKCDVCNLEFVSKQILAQHYGSRKCRIKRNEEPQILKEKDFRKSGKGSVEKMKKMLQCEEDTESDEEIEESIILSSMKYENMSSEED